MAVTLEWDRNPETNVFAYNVWRGTNANASNYVQRASVTNATRFTLTNEPTGIHWYAVTAVDDSGLESLKSATVSWTNRPAPPKGVLVTMNLQGSASVQGPWTNFAQVVAVELPQGGGFYRGRLNVKND